MVRQQFFSPAVQHRPGFLREDQRNTQKQPDVFCRPEPGGLLKNGYLNPTDIKSSTLLNSSCYVNIFLFFQSNNLQGLIAAAADLAFIAVEAIEQAPFPDLDLGAESVKVITAFGDSV